jgi:MFS family permease
MLTPAQYRRNAILHTFSGIFSSAAVIVISAHVVLAGMITELGGSDLILGLVPLVICGGMLVPQMFYAKHSEGIRHLRGRILSYVSLRGVVWFLFLVSLSVWWRMPHTLVALMLTLLVASVALGFIIPIWTDWYARTLPEKLWGRILGVRQAASGILGIGLGFLVNRVLVGLPTPRSYQVLVGIGACCLCIAGVCISMVKELPIEGLPNQRGATWGEYLRGLGRILFRRRDFRRFKAAFLAANVPFGLLGAFLTRYGLSHKGVPGSVVGAYTIFYFGAWALGSPVAGWLTGRGWLLTGYRVFPLFTVAAALIAICSSHPAVVCAAFGLYGMAFGMRLVVAMPAVLRYAGPFRRPSYIALSFTVLMLADAICPPVAGALLRAKLISYRHVFALCAVLSVAAWLRFLRMPEPKREPEPEASRPADGRRTPDRT